MTTGDRPASQARRAAAALVDAAVWTPVGVLIWRRRRTQHPVERPSWRRRAAMKLPPAAFVVGTTVLLGGTPGCRLLGLRVVDRATGASLGWRQACLRWAAATVPTFVVSELVRAYIQKPLDPFAQRGQEFQERLERLHAEHGDDAAFDRAVEDLPQDLGIDPAVGLKVVVPIALGTAWWGAAVVAARLDPQRRTLPDRVAGTLVVRFSGAARRHTVAS